VEQRRLAGTVRADQPGDTPGGHVERHVAIGDDAAEAFGNAAHFQQRTRRAHVALCVRACGRDFAARRRLRSVQPRMPDGKNTTMTTISNPIATRCQPSRYVQNSSCVTWNTTAPRTGPQSVPLPPSTAISTIHTPNVAPANARSRGSMNPTRLPTGPPAAPRNSAAVHQANTL